MPVEFRSYDLTNVADSLAGGRVLVYREPKDHFSMRTDILTPMGNLSVHKDGAYFHSVVVQPVVATPTLLSVGIITESSPTNPSYLVSYQGEKLGYAQGRIDRAIGMAVLRDSSLWHMGDSVDLEVIEVIRGLLGIE